VTTFTDAKDQEWRLEFDGFLLDRIEKEAQIDLGELSAGGLLAVDRDVRALVRVLVVACDDQIKERQTTPKDFQKQIRKDAITRARKAVMEALADFFPESEWSAMQSSLTKKKNQPEMTPEQLQLALSVTRMDPEAQRDLMSIVRQEMAEDGNSPSSPASESALDQDTTPPKPADDSPENVTLAPVD